NWYAVMGIHDEASLLDASLRKEFAPEGWHVPTDAEWTTLENYLIANGYNYDQTTSENKIAKAMAATTGWNSSTELGAIGNDQSTNNSSGFYAFPEGDRYYNGSFFNEGDSALFWSSTETSSNYAWYRYLKDNYSSLSRSNSFKQIGFSVRFVRD
ncbi:fibrobacter succinogenes major paralogous domain-containing protein, partial [Flavobacteriaceae bacterium]|nr:fibrobacter succinogenes major paralogous domain-containing protein [Flavobacteriaceae bacterium]